LWITLVIGTTLLTSYCIALTVALTQSPKILDIIGVMLGAGFANIFAAMILAVCAIKVYKAFDPSYGYTNTA
jgi:hypothetical protein